MEEEVKEDLKGGWTYMHKTYKQRQEEAAVKEAAKTETVEQKAERLGKEAAEARVKRAKGSSAYSFTQTGGAKRGQGRTVVNAPTDRPKGKMALKKVKKEKVKRLKAA